MSAQDSEKIKCRSSKHANNFEWKINYFLCGDKCESKKNFLKDWRLAATMEIRQRIKMRCEERMRKNTEDQWAFEVVGRANFVAAEGRYHLNCYARLCSQRDLKKAENT